MKIAVAGLGMTGATISRLIANNTSAEIDIYESRDHIAGNMHDPIQDDGQRIHKYGPHLFHTNSEEVFKFLSLYTDWEKFEYRAVAPIEEQMIPVPFNFTGIEALLGNSSKKIINHLKQRYLPNENTTVLKLLQSEDNIERQIGELAYKMIFENYTKKQWGKYSDIISSSVLSRVPVRMGYDDRYFNDRYQFLPSDGYDNLIKNMISHPQINIFLSTQFSIDLYSSYDMVVYTGPIDSLLSYQFGELPYRSIRFELQKNKTNKSQNYIAVNHTLSGDYTRSINYTKMLGPVNDISTVIYEYPEDFISGKNDPYYPVPSNEGNLLYNKYLNILNNNYPNIIPCGRLGSYRYYNMDQACKSAILEGNKIVKRILDE